MSAGQRLTARVSNLFNLFCQVSSVLSLGPGKAVCGKGGRNVRPAVGLTNVRCVTTSHMWFVFARGGLYSLANAWPGLSRVLACRIKAVWGLGVLLRGKGRWAIVNGQWRWWS